MYVNRVNYVNWLASWSFGKCKKFNENRIRKVINTNSSSFLINKINEGKYEWEFKIINIDNNDDYAELDIGIWKTRFKKKITNSWFNSGANAYVFSFNQGILWDKKEQLNWKKYGIKVKSGYTINMILDIDKRTLSFNINDKDYGVAFDNIEVTSYTAAINCYSKGTHIELL